MNLHIYAPLAQLDRAWVFYTNGCRFDPTWCAIFQGEKHAPNKTNLLSSRLGIFRFLYGERVSEVWEGYTCLDLKIIKKMEVTFKIL